MRIIGYPSYQALASSPACPSNEDDGDYTYEVRKEVYSSAFLARAIDPLLADFDDVEDAIAFIGNLEREYTSAVHIYRVARHDQSDYEIIFTAEWDEDVCRYLNN